MTALHQGCVLLAAQRARRPAALVAGVPANVRTVQILREAPEGSVGHSLAAAARAVCRELPGSAACPRAQTCIGERGARELGPVAAASVAPAERGGGHCNLRGKRLQPHCACPGRPQPPPSCPPVLSGYSVPTAQASRPGTPSPTNLPASIRLGVAAEAHRRFRSRRSSSSERCKHGF